MEEQDVLRTSDQPITPYISDSVLYVDAATPLRDVAERLRADDIGLVAIGDADTTEGVVSERDIVTSVALGLDADDTPAGQIESDDLVWATTDSTVGEVAEQMMEHYIRHILIQDDTGSLVGIVSMRDLLTAYLD